MHHTSIPPLTNQEREQLLQLYEIITRKVPANSELWFKGLQVLYGYGLGMEEATWRAHEVKGAADFIDWVLANGYVDEVIDPEMENVLSEEELKFWQTNGYVVVKNAATSEQVKAATQAIWEYTDASAEDPESWYKPHAAKRGLMLVFTQHPALRALRNSPRVRKAYEQLYGTPNIFKTIDKVSVNPPETDTYRFMGSAVHWDVSLAQPIPEKYQGLMYLTDVGPNDGAFQCVPGFHHAVGDWLKTIPVGVNPRDYAQETLKVIPVVAQAGDFIIWHQALPHCASPNKGQTPRLVLYLTYIPNNHQDHKEWI